VHSSHIQRTHASIDGLVQQLTGTGQPEARRSTTAQILLDPKQVQEFKEKLTSEEEKNRSKPQTHTKMEKIKQKTSNSQRTLPFSTAYVHCPELCT